MSGGPPASIGYHRQMSRIRVLDPIVVDRIAAGEVVERPESVVKELIENSLDAGARRVEVRIEAGGRSLIEVGDDGHGMDAADAGLAFTQHATSKIDTVEDLDHIATLGFRGEALASIAAVSRVELLTGSGDGVGTRLRVEGGIAGRVESAAAPRGTRIRVRDLFFNTPARHKHLKTDSTELGRVAAVVQQFALLRPEVHFTLTAEGRERLVAPPVAGLAERVHQVLGADVAEAWIPVEDSGRRIAVSGGVTDPQHTRGDRRQVYLFVNGRAIADGRLAHAVISAYDTLLERRRFPVAVLFLQLPEDDVDVNVHPRKAEVRFVDPGRAYAAVRRAVQLALAHHMSPPKIRFNEDRRPPPGLDGGGAPSLRGALEASLPLRDWRSIRPSGGGAPEGQVAEPEKGSAARTPAFVGTRGALQPLAQYANTYILAADDDGLLVIDQHVAHERVLFERILAQRRARAIPVQRLLVPETLDLSPQETATAEEHGEILAELGFEIEPFGGTTWAIRSVPEVLRSGRGGPTVRALLDTLAAELGPEAGGDAERELAASLACHAAVRANQPLSMEVMSFLLGELAECEAPTRCPHGRPVLIRLEHGDLERRLGRH